MTGLRFGASADLCRTGCGHQRPRGSASRRWAGGYRGTPHGRRNAGAGRPEAGGLPARRVRHCRSRRPESFGPDGRPGRFLDGSRGIGLAGLRSGRRLAGASLLSTDRQPGQKNKPPDDSGTAPVRRTGTDWTRSVSPGTRCLPIFADRRPHWTSCRREGRLADSHLTSPLIMHAFGPPPLSRTSHVSRRFRSRQEIFAVRTITPAAGIRDRTTMRPWTGPRHRRQVMMHRRRAWP
jgi:hypothetical protein